MLDTGKLDRITTLPALIDYLRDELDWPIEDYGFEDLTYEWDPRDFGLKESEVSGQVEIKQLRPLGREPWGIFFLSLPHRKLPITVLRRILGKLAVKKRASSNVAERAAWAKGDLLFIAAHGAGEERGLAFAHFHEDGVYGDLPTLKVLGWDGGDTIRRLSATHASLQQHLSWRVDDETDDAWRTRWYGAFREKPGEVVATSKAMAKELARLAREIRRRANELLDEENEEGPLRTLHAAFKEALIHDLKHDDFADMYAQTIAYGLLSARISRESGALVADDAAELAPPTNPFLRELMQTFLKAGGRKGGMDFDELGVNDVVEMLRRADMYSVLLDFDTRNPNEDPVIHFYELFLKEYDAKKRLQRGVFYTPRPVVSFIVRSVDGVLRTEFGLEDGLASIATWDEVIAARPEIELPAGAKKTDPFVRILDPATGTGTFLVEAVDLIHDRMTEKWREAGKRDREIEALWNEYVPRHLLPRLYGFELMMAPYAIAHMKLGLKLAETGYHFRSDERARIYLTNSLEPAQDFDMQLAFMSEALAHEAQTANAAKEVRFTVVVGNPPYAVSSQNAGTWINQLLDSYKEAVRHERNIQPLSDDYIKFFRLIQFYISQTGCGCIGFVTNHTFLSGVIHRGIRSQLLEVFNSLSFLNLNGSALLGLTDAERGQDQNVFDIQQGVCVSVAIRSDRSAALSDAQYGSLWGMRDQKFEALLANEMKDLSGTALHPNGPGFWFVPREAADADYDEWVSVAEIFGAQSTGLETGRDEVLIAFQPEDLLPIVRDLHSRDVSAAELRDRYGLTDTSGWPVARRRHQLQRQELPILLRGVRSITYRPFDSKYTLYGNFLRRAQLDNMKHMLSPNIGLVSSRLIKGETPAHAFVSNQPIEKILLSPKTSNNAFLFPLYIIETTADDEQRCNLSRAVTDSVGRALHARFKTASDQGDLQETFGARDVFDWIYAVLNSPDYRSRYADYLQSDFARVPLPGSRALFQALVPLGSKLVALHLLDVDAASELKDPQEVRFAGHGEARVEQAPTWSPPNGGRVTISSRRWFEGVPERVWNFHIGGYQPAQKWLKDRAKKGGRKPSPGRILTAEDILHYRRMIVSMDRTIDIMAEIDRVIEKHGGWPDAFRGMAEQDETEAER